MRTPVLSSAPRAAILIVALSRSFAVAFHRDACMQTAHDMLGNHTLSPTSSFFFRDTFDGPIYNGVENMTLTLQGCDALCGPKQTWYTDIGPRLGTWLIPILLLVANIDLSPLDKQKALTILHLLGDPIDSLWSLLHKLDAWDRCLALAARYSYNACPSCQQIVASVFAGHEEIQGPRIESERYFAALVEQHSLSTQFNEWRRAALRLADGRTNELNRTIFAFLLYVFQLVAAFVPQVGGTPPGPPGGRIATAVLLSWLVPAALVSNIVGNLASRRIAHDVLIEHATNTDQSRIHIEESRSVLLPTFDSLARKSSADYTSAMPWSGAIYTYRPWKFRYITHTSHRHMHTSMIAVLATLPVLSGFIGGVLILWYQLPVGLNCRHVWLVGVTLLWNLSAILTMTTYSLGLATGKYHWYFTLVKDACVAIPSFVVMFLSAVGMFNFCWCWSGPFRYQGTGRVPLSEKTYYINARSIYPTIVGAVLLVELTLVIAIALIWRRGIRLLRWTERRRQTEWHRLMNNDTCPCVQDRLVRDRQFSDASEMSLLKPSMRRTTSEASDWRSTGRERG